MHPYRLRCTFYRHRPRDSPLDKLFYLRPQFGFRQSEIIDCTSAQDRHSGKASAAAVHKSSACLAKIIRHRRVRTHCFSLAEVGKIVFATDVLEMRVRHGDVGLVEGRSNLAAVETMADMTIYQARFLERL